MNATLNTIIDAEIDESPAQRALSAATVALMVAVGSVFLFLPGLFERYLTSTVRIVAVALVLAAALLLHWVFVGLAARRLGRSMLGWLALAVALFPIGGAAALILLAWLQDESPTSAFSSR